MTGPMREVTAAIEGALIRRDTYEWILIPSETGDEAESSRFLAGLLEREGFEARLDPVDGDRANVYATMRGSGGGPALVWNGHTDTIPIGQCAAPAIDGDWVVGRGAEDMKGGLVAMVHAASAIRKAGVRLRGDVHLTGVIDHETPRGKKAGPLRLIERVRAGAIGAAGIVIVEGPFAVWSASLGSTLFHVTIRSERPVVHTVKVPYAENPARWMGALLEEFARMEREFQGEEAHPLCGHERLNVGIVQAGDYPNRLPNPARVTGTWRWKPGKSHAEVRGALEALCGRLSRESGLEFEAAFEAQREPFEVPGEHALVRAVREGAIETGTQLNRIGMALVGDANLYCNLAGVPTVYLGPAHETAHSDFERVSVSRLVECARIYAAAMIRFCGIAE